MVPAADGLRPYDLHGLLRDLARAACRHRLSSKGAAFGDAGFYRVCKTGEDRLLVWRVSTLHEAFRVYVDDAQVLRCDHSVRFLGLPVLHLHYRIERTHDPAPA